jgi:hypothetical protein
MPQIKYRVCTVHYTVSTPPTPDFPQLPSILRIQVSCSGYPSTELPRLRWIRQKALPPSGWRREFLLILVTCPTDFHFPQILLQAPISIGLEQRFQTNVGVLWANRSKDQPADQKDSTATTGALLGVIDPSAVSAIVPKVVRHSTFWSSPPRQSSGDTQ